MSVISKLFISALFLSFSFSAFAGDELLNGGDVIECPSYEVPFYISLDLYEGESIYDLKGTEFSNTNYKSIVNMLINRIAVYDMTRANLYRSFLRAFDKEARFVQGSEFGNIRDEGPIAIPEGCELKQAAAQFRANTPDGIKYIFSLTLWNRMNEATKAGLVMHEIIYREGLLPKNGFKNSAKVRYFNAFVHSRQMEKGNSAAEYANAVKFAGFKN